MIDAWSKCRHYGQICPAIDISYLWGIQLPNHFLKLHLSLARYKERRPKGILFHESG